MKRPVLEVIRFDEADIVTASGMGFTAANFGDNTWDNGIFTFFGGTGPGSVSTKDGDDAILIAFNQYFGGRWGSTKDISIHLVNEKESSLDNPIGWERGESYNWSASQRYNGTYDYMNGGFYWSSN